MTIKAKCTTIRASSDQDGKNSKTLDKRRNTEDMVHKVTYVEWSNEVNGDNEKYGDDPNSDEK